MEISVTITNTGTTTSYKASHIHLVTAYIAELVKNGTKFTVIYS